MVPSAQESYLLPADLSRASHAFYVQFIELLITVIVGQQLHGVDLTIEPCHTQREYFRLANDLYRQLGGICDWRFLFSYNLLHNIILH
jgi:hypothetical protein